MHLIILLCGLFMHLISSHPYSLPTKALTHTLSKQSQRAAKEDEHVSVI